MKKRIILLVLALTIIISSIALATNWDKVTAVIRSSITIVLDGNVLNMKDANGNKVDPIIIDGTTYLPLRALGETLGKKVTWNGDTETITLGDLDTVNLVSVASFTKKHYGDIIKGESTLTFDNIGDTGVKYQTAVKVDKYYQTMDSYTTIKLSGKYQYMDCDLLYIPKGDEKALSVTIKDADTELSCLSKVIDSNKIYHCNKLEVSGITNMTFFCDNNSGWTDGYLYFLNPILY